jgi:hypothetical protein
LTETTREAVGIFSDVASYEAAIDELESSGFDRAELSVLASEATVEEKLGHKYQRAAELEDDPDAPRIAFISEESIGAAEAGLISGFFYYLGFGAGLVTVATGGAFGAILMSAAIGSGAGAVIGSVLAGMVGKHHADFLHDHIDHGGLLLWVHLRDDAHEKSAVDILTKHSAHDVHVHDIRV